MKSKKNVFFIHKSAATCLWNGRLKNLRFLCECYANGWWETAKNSHKFCIYVVLNYEHENWRFKDMKHLGWLSWHGMSISKDLFCSATNFLRVRSLTTVSRVNRIQDTSIFWKVLKIIKCILFVFAILIFQVWNFLNSFTHVSLNMSKFIYSFGWKYSKLCHLNLFTQVFLKKFHICLKLIWQIYSPKFGQKMLKCVQIFPNLFTYICWGLLKCCSPVFECVLSCSKFIHILVRKQMLKIS